MGYIIFKTVITALVITLISEISKRFTFMASLLTALPVTSILIFIWIYFEQKNIEKISTMSQEIFFLVIPSLAFFVLLPFLLKRLAFFPAFVIDALITWVIYVGYIKVLRTIKPDLI